MGNVSPPLFVSLTTLPSRIFHIQRTLDSLCNQTQPPDMIFLCLPRWSIREQCEYPRPDWLSEYRAKLKICETEEDYGPGTKLLGCLNEISVPSCLVVADDDMAYKSYFLQTIYNNQTANPKASFSFYTYPAGPFEVGQGADGFSFFTPNLVGIKKFAKKALTYPQLRVVDDLWISAFLKRNGIPVRTLKAEIPTGETVYEITHTMNQLHHLKGDLERERAMAQGIQQLRESGLLGRRQQIFGMMKKIYHYAMKMST